MPAAGRPIKPVHRLLLAALVNAGTLDVKMAAVVGWCDSPRYHDALPRIERYARQALTLLVERGFAEQPQPDVFVPTTYGVIASELQQV